MGIDPGSRVTGYGIIEVQGARLRHLASGCIRSQGDDLGVRLKQIFAGVAEMVTEFAPDELAIEKVFVQRNVDSALKLGQARGAALCAAAMRDVRVYEYFPNQIKQAVVGHGHAAKEQVQAMVRMLLRLEALPQRDAADALACAVCHSHLRSTAQRWRELQVKVVRP
jgi:crossover junction endodeoxyribonuclease RuvC